LSLEATLFRIDLFNFSLPVFLFGDFFLKDILTCDLRN
jgi:hypothetical protein